MLLRRMRQGYWVIRGKGAAKMIKSGKFLFACFGVALICTGMALGGSTATSARKTIRGCVNKKTGVVRVAAKCKKGERKIAWNVRGAQGAAGVTGSEGANGLDGHDGAQGAKGDKGDRGEAGSTGAQGPKGDKGDQGVKGDNGNNGQDGAQGPKGDKGDKGDTGNNGANGQNGQDGAAGVNAVEASVLCDAGGWQFNTLAGIIDLCNGTPGADGRDGAQGPQGDKGDKGDKGDNGLNGVDGAQGPKGDKGDKGDPGANGAQGPQGPKGDAGTASLTQITKSASGSGSVSVQAVCAAGQVATGGGFEVTGSNSSKIAVLVSKPITVVGGADAGKAAWLVTGKYNGESDGQSYTLTAYVLCAPTG